MVEQKTWLIEVGLAPKDLNITQQFPDHAEGAGPQEKCWLLTCCTGLRINIYEPVVGNVALDMDSVQVSGPAKLEGGRFDAEYEYHYHRNPPTLRFEDIMVKAAMPHVGDAIRIIGVEGQKAFEWSGTLRDVIHRPILIEALVSDICVAYKEG